MAANLKHKLLKAEKTRKAQRAVPAPQKPRTARRKFTDLVRAANAASAAANADANSGANVNANVGVSESRARADDAAPPADAEQIVAALPLVVKPSDKRLLLALCAECASSPLAAVRCVSEIVQRVASDSSAHYLEACVVRCALDACRAAPADFAGVYLALLSAACSMFAQVLPSYVVPLQPAQPAKLPLQAAARHDVLLLSEYTLFLRELGRFLARFRAHFPRDDAAAPQKLRALADSFAALFAAGKATNAHAELFALALAFLKKADALAAAEPAPAQRVLAVIGEALRSDAALALSCALVPLLCAFVQRNKKRTGLVVPLLQALCEVRLEQQKQEPVVEQLVADDAPPTRRRATAAAHKPPAPPASAGKQGFASRLKKVLTEEALLLSHLLRNYNAVAAPVLLATLGLCEHVLPHVNLVVAGELSELFGVAASNLKCASLQHAQFLLRAPLLWSAAFARLYGKDSCSLAHDWLALAFHRALHYLLRSEAAAPAGGDDDFLQFCVAELPPLFRKAVDAEFIFPAPPTAMRPFWKNEATAKLLLEFAEAAERYAAPLERPLVACCQLILAKFPALSELFSEDGLCCDSLSPALNAHHCAKTKRLLRAAPAPPRARRGASAVGSSAS